MTKNLKNVDLDILCQDVDPAVRELTARPGIGLDGFIKDPSWMEEFMALHGHEF
jgi:hypothetical protein